MDATLDDTGQLTAHMFTDYYGQTGTALRYSTKHESADQLKKRLERSFSRRLGGVALEKISPEDHAQDGRLRLPVDFGVTKFGQVQSRLLILKPGTLVPDPEYSFTNKERKLPVKLTAHVRKDSVTLKLPPGFGVDEIPDPVEIESPYGNYRASWKGSSEEVVFEQSVEIKDMVAPVAEYAQIRDFFDKVPGWQNAAVVLVKK